MSISYFFRGNLPPSVSSLSATPASVASGATVTLSAVAADLDGSVQSVEYFLNGVSVGTSTSGGSNFALPFTATTVGSFATTARAMDNLGVKSALFAGPGLSVTGANTAPGQVTNLASAAASSGSVTLSYAAPANGGAAILDYLVEFRTGAAAFAAFAHSATTATTQTVTGLLAATSYDFRVSAINSVGTGLASVISTASTPAANSLTVNSSTPS